MTGETSPVSVSVARRALARAPGKCHRRETQPRELAYLLRRRFAHTRRGQKSKVNNNFRLLTFHFVHRCAESKGLYSCKSHQAEQNLESLTFRNQNSPDDSRRVRDESPTANLTRLKSKHPTPNSDCLLFGAF